MGLFLLWLASVDKGIQVWLVLLLTQLFFTICLYFQFGLDLDILFGCSFSFHAQHVDGTFLPDNSHARRMYDIADDEKCSNKKKKKKKRRAYYLDYLFHTQYLISAE